MSTMKKCKVILLESKKEQICHNLWLDNIKDQLFLYSTDEGDRMIEKPIFLYFLSDEKIKKEDIWLYDNNNKIIVNKNKVYEEFTANKFFYNKIIATTDSSLTKTPFKILKDLKFHQLPQPSLQFLEVFVKEYNKGNVIKEVLVEYERGWAQQQYSEVNIEYHQLKIDKNNTVTIKRVKDSWNREEVCQLIIAAHVVKYNKLIKWIDKNL